MAEDHRTRRWNRALSSNFWWLRSTNHVKFTEECVMNTEKHVLVKRNVYKLNKHGFASTGLNRKQSPSIFSTVTLQ